MFFVVLWEVVSPPKAIFDILTPDQENCIFRLQNEAYLGGISGCFVVQSTAKTCHGFYDGLKVDLSVRKMYPTHHRVSLGSRENISRLQIISWKVLW